MMLRIRAVAYTAMLLIATQARAQTWNDARTLQLVNRATERRAQQLADTGLRDYKSVAHGYVTFLAQLGEGLKEPPKVVKADELVNELYWLSPNLSKQRIVGRRDTLLLPTDISYHRDHLGIVQNNFPAIIRLGDGDEVVDVPHPLSSQGLAAYDFVIADSLSLTLPGRTIPVFEVKVRPKDDKLARIIGAVFITEDDAQVVKMAFNFTRAAFRDESLNDLFVVIENRLVGGRFWLPSRQEIEIQRGGTWLEYPVRGIIRGRWDIGEYEVNVGLAREFFNGQEIVLAPKAATDTFHFQGRILDSLPADVRAVTDAEIRQVQAEARSLVRAQAMRRPQAFSLAATNVSDFVRFNRVEGLAVGAGITSAFGGGFSTLLRGRFGIDDRAFKGTSSLSWDSPSVSAHVFAERRFGEAGDIAERSRALNSLAAQEFGSDYTDPFLSDRVGGELDYNLESGLRLRSELAFARNAPLALHAPSTFGSFPRVLAAERIRERALTLGLERPTGESFVGFSARASAELRLSNYSLDSLASGSASFNALRAFASIQAERPMGNAQLATMLSGGFITGDGRLPSQYLLYFGGPVSAPGYEYHSLAATNGATLRIELREKIGAPSLSLGRFGKTPHEATLAPFVQVTYAHQASPLDLLHPTGAYPSVGIALQPFFDLVRFQIARGLRHGEWTFNVDVSRDLWSVL